MLLDPPAQILVDHREDARCRAPAHCDGRLDFRQDTVQGGRGEFGWRFGHWQGQEDSDVLAVLAFVKDDAGPGFLDPVMYPELVERNRLGHDVIWHAILLGDGAEPGLDSEQLVRVLVDLMLKLGTPQEEHAAKLAEGDPVQQPSDLGKREPEFLQRNDPANLSQPGCRLAAVPRVRIDRRRPQQPDLVVVPERANRHPTEPRELADAEHGTSMHPSPCERVKTIPRMNPNPHRDLDADPARPRLPCRAPGRIHTPALSASRRWSSAQAARPNIHASPTLGVIARFCR
jgi:hypothetical protein